MVPSKLLDEKTSSLNEEFCKNVGSCTKRLLTIRMSFKRLFLKELSNALLCGAIAHLVPELCASLSKNVEIGQIVYH